MWTFGECPCITASPWVAPVGYYADLPEQAAEHEWVTMADRGIPRSEWGRYLRRMTSALGWSVARLARESGIHRATIFDWIRGDGESVTISSVRAVADAFGDDLHNALRAAAGLAPSEPDCEAVQDHETSGRQSEPPSRQPMSAGLPPDEEVELIQSAPVGDDIKGRMLERLEELRDQHRQQRKRILEWMVSQEVEFHRVRNQSARRTPAEARR